MSSELRATLAISRSEALSGTSRTLTLPGGRKVTIDVPAGAYDGQVIRVEDQAYGGPDSTLLLTLAVIQAEPTIAPPDPNLELPTIAASSPYAQNPSTPSPTPIPYYQKPSTTTPHLYEENPPSSTQPPTVATHITNPQQTVLPPFYTQEESITAPPPPPPAQAAAVYPPPVNGRSPLTNVRAMLLVGLALLVIAGGVGLFFVLRANQATNSANATATAQIGATVKANASNATATAQASSVAATSVAFNATATVQAQASATAAVIAANPNPYGGGTLALYDPLRDNNSGYSWSIGSDNMGGSCKFTGGAYHVSESNTSTAYDCFASADFSNFVYEVQMKIINGDAGGIIFRADTTNSTSYVFYVSQDGNYELLLCPKSACHALVTTTSSSAIHQGLGQTNIIAVVAQGNMITLYVNHQQITSVTDGTFRHGQIGVTASPYTGNGHPTEAVFSNAKAWKL